MTYRDDTMTFQRRLGVHPDGQFGPATLAAANRRFDALEAATAPQTGAGLSGGADGVAPATGQQGQPGGLPAPKEFFAIVRHHFGPLEQPQIDGFNVLLNAMAAERWPLAWMAYGLATGWHETARTMQPVEEAFWKNDAWRKANLRYYPWHGRGYVQITWEQNYKRADAELNLGGQLTSDPTKAMQPDIAARILSKGMSEGWFTGKKLSDYLPAGGPGAREQHKQARRIINGTDKWEEIAELALKFQHALKAGGMR